MATRKTNDSASFFASIVIGGSLLFLLVLTFSWGNSLIRNANIDYQLSTFEEENENIRKKNEILAQQLGYLQSAQYRDKWAKEHQGLAQPGEKVLSIEFASYTKKPLADTSGIMNREILLMRPNREQWKLLFFPEK